MNRDTEKDKDFYPFCKLNFGRTGQARKLHFEA